MISKIIMHVTNISDAKAQLSRLIEMARNGEEIIISKAGKPVVRLVVYSESPPLRKPGVWKGKIKIAPDFDELPSDILLSFHENPISPSA